MVFALFSLFFLRLVQVLETNEGQFCPRCPAGGPDLEKLCFFVFTYFPLIAKLPNLRGFEHREYASLLSFEKCCRMH